MSLILQAYVTKILHKLDISIACTDDPIIVHTSNKVYMELSAE